MSNGDNETLGGLAKRWLKNQLAVHGDPGRSTRERRESEAIEERIAEKAQEDLGRALFDTFAPAGLKDKLAGLERMRSEEEQRREAQRRADREALPRAEVQMTLSGHVDGTLSEAMPVTLNRPSDAGEALALELSPLESASIGGREFQLLGFAIPGYSGAGQYDLSAIAHADDMADWDPFWFQLMLDPDSESFYWVPEYGRATVIVEPGERVVRLRMPMENAGGERVEVTATVALP